MAYLLIILSEEKIFNMNNIIIADNLRQLMKENQINQMKLSKDIGVTQSAVSNWLNGNKEPSINSLWLLADYFDVSVDYLIGRKEY